MTLIRRLWVTLWAVAVTISLVALAYGGASDYGDLHPRRMKACAGIALAGAVVQLLVRPIRAYWIDRERMDASKAQFYAQRLWEDLVLAGVGLNLGDIGVHVYAQSRRVWPFWRFTYQRIARMAVTSRASAPGHAKWPEHWWTGRADGMVGLAVRQPDPAVLAVDLQDADHADANPTSWNAWYSASDIRALGVSWDGGTDARHWFSTVWATPIRRPSGEIVGVLTLNVERRVRDGYALVNRARGTELLHRAAQDIAVALDRRSPEIPAGQLTHQ